MKFLKEALEGDHLMFLKTYYHPGSRDYDKPDDVLDIVYKNVDSGKIHVESIEHPKIEIFIVKEEYRNFDHYPNYLKKKECDSFWVPYKLRFKDVGKILGVNAHGAKFSNLVGQLDMDIEHFYMMMFYKEYGQYTSKHPLTLAYSDIEADTISINHFPSPGEVPINAISYFDETTDTMYTFICTQDNVPHVPKTDHRYERFEKLRNRFKKQVDEFVADIDGFKEECKKDFEESYGEIEYKILLFDTEIEMLVAYWDLIDLLQNDLCFFWNAPFDISNLVERCRAIGYDPSDVIPMKRFRGIRIPHWYEDKNPQAHKRKHIFDLYTKTTFMDQMVNYAGIRSGKGKLPSVKLTRIAENEIEDEKLDYSEYGNLRMFPYYNFRQFIKYNIKDVLLQVGIDRKVRDSEYVYLVMYTTCIKPNELFTTTTFDGNDIRLFIDMHYDVIFGQNKNKLYRVKKTKEEIKEAKKKKFSGAFVMNPDHIRSTGFKLLGALNNLIHEHVIDEDIGSEYPTGMLIMNCCNDTMLGKVFLVNEDDIEIKLYDNMYIVDGDDQVIYNKTSIASNLMMEALTENNPTEFGRQYFKLPTFTEIASNIEKNIDLFIDA